MGLETLLGSLKDFVMSFSNMISKTIDSDVIIVDNNLDIVGTAFRYFTLYNDIEVGSIVAEVIMKKKVITVKDKSEKQSCIKCAQYHSCKMVGFVGIPIFYNGYVIGAIALTLPQHRVDSIFNNIDTFIEFLENMAELLSGKIKEVNYNNSLNQTIAEREAMMDLINEAVVFTDIYGNIQHMNKRFRKLFGITKSCIDKRIQDILPHAIFQDYFQEDIELNNLRLYFTVGSATFYGFLTSKGVKINGKQYGTMFAFQTVNQVLRNARLSEKGSLVTLHWLEWILPKDIIHKAKKAAGTNQHLFIHSKNRNLNELLVKGIANYSDRSLKGLKILYCDNMYRDFMNIFLFDEFGELRDANEGIMFMQDVENLPLYIQEKLLYYMKTGKVPLNNKNSIHSDVRLLFGTTKDLQAKVEEGLFLEELYYRMVENTIEINNTQDDTIIYRRIIDTGITFYSKLYHKEEINLSEEVMKYLYENIYLKDLNHLESVIELLVKSNNFTIELADLHDMNLYHEPILKPVSVSSYEKDKIIELIELGCTKTEIAKKIGIGRATLYRRLEEYGLN